MRLPLRLGGALLVLAGTALALGGPGAPAGATTSATTLVGEGGAYLQPVTDRLLHDDSAGLSPIYGSYLNVDLDAAIKDFVGTGKGKFGADWLVSERPLTSGEAQTAATDGRTFAYVPFAAGPTAVVTLVPNAAWSSGGTGTIEPEDFCPHIPLTTTLLGDIFGFDSSDPLLHWNDPRLTCDGVGTSPNPQPVTEWANLDPTMENEAIMTLLDSNPTSKALFQAGLDNAKADSRALTTSVTPSEVWPYAEGTSVPGGDEPLVGKLLAINALTNAPSTSGTLWQLGAAVPMSSVWTGAPLGVVWDLPTAAIQNAQGSFVAPSAASAEAAQADATLAQTTDPLTDNLVTFKASTTDAAAYNNYLMEESYLVVPTDGLPAQKYSELAQFIRFIVGTTGQADIASFGAAPATPAMVAADLQVANQLDQLAAAGSTTTATTTPGSGTTPGANTQAPSGNTGSGSSGSGGSGSGSSLAFTGADVVPLVVLGSVLVVVGEVARRRLRRRGVAWSGARSGSDAPGRRSADGRRGGSS